MREVNQSERRKQELEVLLPLATKKKSPNDPEDILQESSGVKRFSIFNQDD